MQKRSIALVIREPAPPRVVAAPDPPSPRTSENPPERWLLVRRPDDDEDLPGIWGLPAGTLRPDESPRHLVRRIGREKLGLRVEPGAPVAAGSAVRPAYRLDLSLWTAAIVDGDLDLAGSEAPSTDTRYAAWRWDVPASLAAGARRGSLCCRLGVDLASTDSTG